MSVAGTVENEQQFDQFIFQRELNEVYLLIDYLSGRPDKTLIAFDNIALADLDAESRLGQLEGADPPVAASAGGLSSETTPDLLKTPEIPLGDVLTKICLLRYPPDGVRQLKAENAAFLLRVRDRLNLLAYPASGMTIAFTAMVAGSMTEPLDNEGSVERRLPALSRRASRATLAFQAYPGLRRRALQAKAAFGALIAVALATAILAVWLSGEVAFAKSLLDRYVVLDNERTALAATISQVESNVPASGQIAPDTAVKGGGVPPYCERPGILYGQDRRFESYTQQHICAQSAHLRRNIEKVQNDLRAWLSSIGHFVPGFLQANWIFDSATQATKTEARNTSGTDDSSAADNADKTYDLPILISSLLTVIGTYLLPMLYGFLGSAASVIRDFSRKMRDSTFAPRDLTLTVVRLALGILAGASVGLFFTPATVAQGDAMPTGAVALSASALAFLAGYGVEVLFSMLDSTIDRVFKKDPKLTSPNKSG
jgi:hypothetical protein